MPILCHTSCKMLRALPCVLLKKEKWCKLQKIYKSSLKVYLLINDESIALFHMKVAKIGDNVFLNCLTMLELPVNWHLIPANSDQIRHLYYAGYVSQSHAVRISIDDFISEMISASRWRRKRARHVRQRRRVTNI